MKRLLSITVAVLLIASLFLCLPKNNSKGEKPTSIDDLDHLNVGVQTGLDYDLIVKEKYPNAKISYYNDFSGLIPAVRQGKIDVYLTDSSCFMVEKRENPDIVSLEEPLHEIDCGIGVTKIGNGPTIRRQLNEFLQKIKADGTYDKMQTYWFDKYNPDTCMVDKSGITGENGELKCVSEASYEPLCMIGKDGELSGYDIDMIYRFCREYGYKPVTDAVEYDAMASAVSSGKYHIGTGIIESEERAEEMLFTEAYVSYDILVGYCSGDGDGQTFFENLRDSFNKTFVKENRWRLFLKGVGITLLITFASVIFGSLLGLLLYLWCYHGKKFENKFTKAFCWFMGSIPTIVLLMILYYVVFENYIITNIIVSIIGFTLIFGGSCYSLIVSGVNAVGIGQMEAAMAQGFSKNQAFFKIILPQAIEFFFQSYLADIVSLIQETSVVGYIAVMDLTKMSDLVRGRTYDAFFPLLASAAMYFVIIWLVTTLVSFIAKRMSTKNRSKKRILKGIIR